MLPSRARYFGVEIGRRSVSSRSSHDDLRSLGALVDPHVYRGPGGTPLPAFASRDGLKNRWKIVKGHIVSGVSAGVIQSRVPDFHASKFPAVANKVFADFLKAHREGDLSTLGGVATEEMLSSIKVTCKLATEREVVMLDGSGKELPQLEGEGQSIFNNVTIGVFEVYFGDSSKRWRLAMLEEVGGLQPEGAASHTP